MSKCGRPGIINPDKIKEAILKYKDIVKKNNTIVSKTHDIWKLIAQDLDNKVTTNNLYVFTKCNRYNIKDIIFNMSCNNNSKVENKSVLSGNADSSEISLYDSPDKTANKQFVILLLRETFKNLITKKIYKREIKKKTYYRLRKVLKAGKWQEVITKKIWETTHMKCGFQFKNHYISTDAKSGFINGKTYIYTIHVCTIIPVCARYVYTILIADFYTDSYKDNIILGSCKCGSILKCIIEDNDSSSNCIKLNCIYTYIKGNCRKRYLRNPMRTNIGKELQTKSVDVYRAEKAHLLMEEGDPESPVI